MTAEARIRGIPDIPSIKEVNVRGDANTVVDIIFKAPVGMDALVILEVKPDSEGKNLNGKIYEWFKLLFHGGAVGWIRDDLLEIRGDVTPFGYGNLTDYTFAHALQRHGAEVSSPVAPTPEPEPKPETQPQPVTDPIATQPEAPATTDDNQFPDALEDTERVRKASLRLTGAFEGHGYATFQNIDAGIISYGFIQFTLAGGSLATVVNRYLSRSDSEPSKALEPFQAAINNRDPMLRNNTNLRDALIAAANDPAMRAVQDQVATEGYWQAVIDGYITHRGLRLPLTWALLFDMGVNFGVNHGFVRLAEKQLNVQPRSRPGENGITEEQLITRVAALRKQSHDRQAERDNLPGLRVRGDFWMGLVNNNDWYLRGGQDGKVIVNGRVIDLLNP